MQKPVYLPQYTGHSEKGSTPLLNVLRRMCSPQAPTAKYKNVDFMIGNIIETISYAISNKDAAN